MKKKTAKTASEIRQCFLDFFSKKNHEVVASHSLIPANDKTLLFTNAGMVPFKDYFLDPKSAPYPRATSSQRCLRVGGKHNDLENVGYTARHHTFFEMLGNFSFGDYFKKEAILYAWEFLIDVLKLPEKRLHASVFEDDDEAEAIWLKEIGLPKKRVKRLGAADNYWSMGDTGPCGPCSEIHFDLGDSSLAPDDRYLEIWNLVFMQFNQDSAGNKTTLPLPSVDTGMGLERITSVVQGVKTNYHTDLFQTLIKTAGDLLHKTYKRGQTEQNASFHVIADHMRAAVFMIQDGILPANEGRGYVLRRLLRRAMRHGRNLGAKEPFLFKMTKTVVEEMRAAYPELESKQKDIATHIEDEEKQFLETLERGMRHLQDILDRLKKDKQSLFPGEDAFHLYETYGFPVDLTEDILRGDGLKLDRSAFDTAFDKHRERARGSWKKSVHVEKFTGKLLDEIQKRGATATNFVGYDTTTSKAKLLVILDEHLNIVEGASDREATYTLIFDTTPFYAESGGQVGDQGWLRSDHGHAEVTNTQKHAGYFLHQVKLLSGKLQASERYDLKIDASRRLLTENNHTLTHILHACLRDVLGDHIRQAGSYLDDKRLTFDFFHPKPITPTQLQAIEKLVNQRIWENHPVLIEETSYDQAIKKGATAFFDEKYGDQVRVVSVGDFSMELCGGTHVGKRQSGSIGLCHIVGERSVAAKTRRIEAVSGVFALDQLQKRQASLQTMATTLKVEPDALESRITSLLQENRDLKKRQRETSKKEFSDMLDTIIEGAKSHESFRVATSIVPEATAEALRDYSDKIMDHLQSGVVALGTQTNGRALLIIKVSKDLTAKYSAAELVKALSPTIGGGGGGRKDMAQAGGSKPEKLRQALDKIDQLL